MKIKNENRPGYKKTKVGWIPEGWEQTSLGKICELQSGKFITASAISEESLNGSFPCFGGNGLRGYVDSYSHDGDYTLIGRQGALCGNVCWVSGKFYATEHAVVATPTDNTLSKWLYYQLHHLNLNEYATGVAQPGLSVQVLNQVMTPAPPLPEQEAIAEVLECWDKGIRTLEKKIGKKRLIKKGLMQRLLSCQVRLPGFSKDWKNVKLGSLGKTISGGTPETEDSNYWNGGIPWCTPTEFAKLETRFIEKTDRTLSELGLKKSSATILPPNSIIVCTRATVGACAINSVPMATNQGFKSLVPNSQTDSTFIYYVLTTLKTHFIRFSSGSTFLELSKRDFEKTKLSIPAIEEQRAIAKILAAADGEIEALERKLALWKDQKKFLLNNLVTGTIRLPEFKN